MEHYFIAKEHSKEDYFTFKENILNVNLEFKSCNDIFSKDRVDYGSKVLINAVYKNFNLNNKVLDIGCGYGAIAIVLSKLFNNAKFYMCDINSTAVELANYNIKLNKCTNVNKAIISDGYNNISDKFNFIITNPPIKAGKQNLLNILKGAYDYLLDDGKLIFVIKKKHGEESIKKELSSLFKQVDIIKRDSGYYILCCSK